MPFKIDSQLTRCVLEFDGVPILYINSDGSVELPNGGTPLGTDLVSAASVFGVGQTWQNVSVSRALNTVYTNTTGRPIQLCVLCTVSTSGSQFTITINGVAIPVGYAAVNSSLAQIQVTIPAGATYSIAGANGSIAAWSELR